MNATQTLSIVGLLLLPGSLIASAQPAAGTQVASSSQSDEGHGIGVGVEATLTGISGAAVVYDAGAFRIDGLLGISAQGDTDLALAGRFWYVLHTGDNSDFSIGGGLGLVDDDQGMGDGDDLDLHVEAGAQLRAFITANVALSASAGFGFILDEGDDFLGFGGQLIGSTGMTYFF